MGWASVLMGVFRFPPPCSPHPTMKNPNKGAQNWYSDAENSLYQPPACFSAQDFVYSIESLGEIIFQIRIFELGFILSHSISKELAYISPFLATAPILYPLEIPGNQKASSIFRGYKMGIMARKSLTKFIITR